LQPITNTKVDLGDKLNGKGKQQSTNLSISIDNFLGNEDPFVTAQRMLIL